LMHAFGTQVNQVASTVNHIIAHALSSIRGNP
jgi:hypothetical protein